MSIPQLEVALTPFVSMHDLHLLLYKQRCHIMKHNLSVIKAAWLKCSPQQGNVQNLCYPFPDLRSRSHLKVQNWLKIIIKFCVRSINPIPIKEFSTNLAEMFTSTRECAEPMSPMCQLKVKVTIKGQISNNKILNTMSCLLCKSYTNWKIFFNLGANVHLNKGVCRTHVTLFPA